MLYMRILDNLVDLNDTVELISIEAIESLIKRKLIVPSYL